MAGVIILKNITMSQVQIYLDAIKFLLANWPGEILTKLSEDKK